MTRMQGGHELISLHSIDLLYEVYSEHPRLQTFAKKGCRCLSCGIEGTQIAVGRDNGGGIHVDLVSDDLRLMTVDHIIPKSKGGANHIDNYQPLCMSCNSYKSDKDMPFWEIMLRRAGFKRQSLTAMTALIAITL